MNVITGLIKANMPSRIAFSVTSGVDSRTIIDMNGAEKLLAREICSFIPPAIRSRPVSRGLSSLTRRSRLWWNT